jgi:sulfide:quinone oxidoreductase
MVCRDVKHYRIAIVGGGTAGITVAAQLSRMLSQPEIVIIEPSRKHYYQPLWTLVGGGVFPKEVTQRDEAAFIPRGAAWIEDAVSEFHPRENRLRTRSGSVIEYDYLVVAAGIQLDWDKIPGLKESLGRDGVCSNYSYEHVDYTWDCIRQFRGGNALFTMPDTPIKCGGAPQKIMYLADDAFRKADVRNQSRVMFASAKDSLFAVERYNRTLQCVVERKQIETLFKHNLVELRPERKEAVFERLDTGQQTTIDYEMVHVAPPMSAPDFIKQSPLANLAGWVEADKYTLQHPRFGNVFSLGDAAGLPTSKTGAAIRKQAPVVVKNLISAMHGKQLVARYDGYTSCPLVTGYGRLVLAEFDYEGQPQETFPIDQSKERYSMYLLKAYGLPRLYWDGMLRGLV